MALPFKASRSRMALCAMCHGDRPIRSRVRGVRRYGALSRFQAFCATLVRVFSLVYALKELRRRFGRTLLTALGLAAGVGLVIGIVGVSDGLDQAQGKVLAPLRSVGTDVLVTRVAGAPANGTTAQTGATQNGPGTQNGQQGPTGFGEGRGGGGGGGAFFGGGIPGLNQTDALALANENQSVTTDLAKLGKPGDHFVHDFFVPATLISFPQ